MALDSFIESTPATVPGGIGPPLAARQITAALALGVISLLVSGVLPSVLGALQDEHRLSASAIGWTATLEALVMGGVTGLAAAFLPAERLRLIGAAASAALGLLDVATMGAQQSTILVLRTLAGIPDGILLWICIGMIARSAVPARWAAVFLTALTAAQAVLASIYGWLIPRYGADGAFATLAACTFGGVFFSIWLAPGYVPLPKPANESGSPPPRGWAALLAALLIVGSASAIGVYLQPLAHEAGLSSDVSRTAVSISLVLQIAGGSLATVMAHRLHWFPAFLVTSAGTLAGWAVFGFTAPGYLFIAANALVGFTTLFVNPFIVPMTIEADPSLRAAMQTAGAQVLGGALGPLFASFVVGASEMHGVLWLGTAMMFAGLAIVTGLHMVARNERAGSAGSAERAGDVVFKSSGGAPVAVSADQRRHDAD